MANCQEKRGERPVILVVALLKAGVRQGCPIEIQGCKKNTCNEKEGRSFVFPTPESGNR